MLKLEILNLGCSTWFPSLDWAGKAVTPRSRQDKIVVFHPLVRLGEAGYQFDHIATGLKVKACSRLYMAFI